MALPLAYFLTSTYYGQRLHGDARGSVDRAHNELGTPPLDPDPTRERRARAAMSGGTITFTPEMCRVAETAFVELCDERQWRLLARAVRSTHCHVVVNCRGESSPERALAQLKARATRDLRRAGLVPVDARLWTRHGSTRWINDEAGLSVAVAYVNDWQAGPNRELLEEHRRKLHVALAQLHAWLRSMGLPTHGRVAVPEYEPRTE